MPNSKIDGELDGYPLSDERLDNIEKYEINCIKSSVEGLKINGRFVLSMIREIRALRKVVETTRGALAQLDLVEMNSKNPHEERWHKVTIAGEITEAGAKLGLAWPGDIDYRYTTLIVKAVEKFHGQPISYRALNTEVSCWKPHAGADAPAYWLTFEEFEIASKILKFTVG